MAKFTGFFEATRQYREKYEKDAIENTQRQLLAFLAMKSGEVKLGKGKVISGEKSHGS